MVKLPARCTFRARQIENRARTAMKCEQQGNIAVSQAFRPPRGRTNMRHSE
jgi:hypothetical protein